MDNDKPDSGADQFFRCTATAGQLLADARQGIDALTDAADAELSSEEIIAELLAALKYARRMLRSSDVDLAYIDAAIAKAGAA